MSFSATKTVSTFKVYISNDLVAEYSEDFYLDLEIPSNAVATGVIKGSPNSATVSITDDDSECCSSALYSSEHNQDIVHLHKCPPERTGCAIYNPLDWSPIKQVFRVKKLVGLPPKLELLARLHYAWWNYYTCPEHMSTAQRADIPNMCMQLCVHMHTSTHSSPHMTHTHTHARTHAHTLYMHSKCTYKTDTQQA